MRGFNNLTLFNCCKYKNFKYISNSRAKKIIDSLILVILNPYQKGDGLVFDNSTQKIALALWSTEKANNTVFYIMSSKCHYNFF